MKQFPDNFFWGAATASYQVEGGIDNNDWALAAYESRVPTCGRACDHYHRYEDDFDIAKALGHTAHRLSVEWSRIEPTEGKFDMDAIAHYRQVLTALRARGMMPIVTLWHFTLPLWFAEQGGFEAKDSPQVFARYAAFVVHQLGDLCDHFSTMNEPNVFASNGYLRGSWPPFYRFSLTDLISITNSGRTHQARPKNQFWSVVRYWRVMKNLARAHNEAYQLIKATSPSSIVSFVMHIIVFDSNGTWFNRLKAKIANHYWTDWFMSRVVACCDEIALNYYFYTQFGDTRQWKKTDMDWNFAPEKIYDALLMLQKYNKPVFVAEAGLADADDSDRAEYITQQISATYKALEAGVDIRGHLYWSLLDNYEWALGFEKRFGLVAVNYETQDRSIRPSALVYKKIIERNGVVE